uniref:Protein suppressor of gene silencing 3 n=1 Tax=Tanacetum cinerariifolium TaxID=118510 RepID=A0A699HEW0_TANCI|nr:protein suppressor of gene silencing 3 [Tanacetum cinerariifolium]
MDYQEQFFKDHLKVIQDSRIEKEVRFDKLLQEARKRVDQAYSAMDLEKRVLINDLMLIYIYKDEKLKEMKAFKKKGRSS